MVKEIKQQLVLVAVVSVIFVVCTGLVVLFSDPSAASWLVLGLFYVSATCAVAGSFTLVFYVLRSASSANVLHADRLSAATREGFLVGILVAVSLALSAARLLFWWVELLLALLLFLTEMFFLV